MKQGVSILIVVVAIVLIGGGYWYYSQNSQKVSTNDSTQKQDGLDNKNNTTSKEDMENGEYTLNTQNSSLRYSSKRLAADPHTGNITISSGNLNITEDGSVDGEFIVDMNTITEDKDNERFLGHVQGDDFFSVQQFPEAKIVITEMNHIQGNQIKFTGDLTIKDITNPIDFIATMTEENGQVMIKSDFSIDRTKWNITFDSGSFFQNLGDRAIEDEIKYSLALALDKK